jgi:hypothetical protein
MAVERIRAVTETHQLGSCRLYREDLQAIAIAVAEAGDLAIFFGDLSASAPEDLADSQIPKTPERVEITVLRDAGPLPIAVTLSLKASR